MNPTAGAAASLDCTRADPRRAAGASVRHCRAAAAHHRASGSCVQQPYYPPSSVVAARRDRGLLARVVRHRAAQHQPRLVLVGVEAEAHAQVGHVCLLDVVAVGAGAPVLLCV